MTLSNYVFGIMSESICFQNTETSYSVVVVVVVIVVVVIIL